MNENLKGRWNEWPNRCQFACEGHYNVSCRKEGAEVEKMIYDLKEYFLVW